MKQGQIVLVNNPKKLQFSHIYTENVLVTVLRLDCSFYFVNMRLLEEIRSLQCICNSFYQYEAI